MSICQNFYNANKWHKCYKWKVFFLTLFGNISLWKLHPDNIELNKNRIIKFGAVVVMKFCWYVNTRCCFINIDTTKYSTKLIFSWFKFSVYYEGRFLQSIIHSIIHNVNSHKTSINQTNNSMKEKKLFRILFQKNGS